MKNRLVTGIAFIILGLLIAVGPLAIFPVCNVKGAAHSAISDMESGGGHDHSTMHSNDHAHSDDHAMTHKHNHERSGDHDSSTPMIMKCHWTAQAELGIGSLIAILGTLLILFASKQLRLGLSISIILNGILAFLIPTVLIGVCAGVHMNCRKLTLPALTILSLVVILAAAINVINLVKVDKKGSDVYVR